MKFIDDLYKPDLVILPVGDMRTMGPKEAAYGLKNLMPTPKTVIPMWLGFSKVEDWDFEGFKKECENIGVKDKTIINATEFYDGKAVHS